MPRGDRTGPDGMGPMTGRGLGYCAGYESPGFTKGVPRGGAGYGRGYGFGHTRGFGYGRGFYQNPYYGYHSYSYSKEDEEQMLSDELKMIKEQANNIEKRLDELKSKNQ